MSFEVNRPGTEEIVRTKSAPLVGALAKIPEVRAISCYGSYAMGTFDPLSDMDLYVLCKPAIVPAAVRRSVLEKVSDIQDLEIGVQEVGWNDAWHPQIDRCQVRGLRFDIAYNTVEWITGVVRAVKDLGIISTPEFGFRAYTVLGLLEHSVTLYDPATTLQALKASLYPYPPKLKRALLAENVAIARGALEDLRDYVKRSIGNTAFHFHYERLLDSLCTILFAINERYDPATKRTEEAIRNLERVPDRFLERYQSILEMPLTPEGRREIVDSLAGLLNEVEALGGRCEERGVT